jgi:DNA mismatch endonuclease (patch repair protein)
MDRLTVGRRSWLMSRVRSKNTTPELIVRQSLTRLGYRYRLHVRDLPGKPDIVFRGRKRAIFVHGCFWHQHPGCSKARLPNSRQSYWGPKLARNRERDEQAAAAIEARGWKIAVVWQCETRDAKSLVRRLVEFLGPPSHAKRRPSDAALPSQSTLVIGEDDGRGTP